LGKDSREDPRKLELSMMSEKKSVQSVSSLLRNEDWPGLAEEFVSRAAKGRGLRLEEQLIHAIALIRLGRDREALQILGTEILQSAKARSLLRRYAISPLISEGRLELALKFLACLLECDEAQVDDMLLVVSLRVRLQEWSDAIAVLDEATRRYPQDRRLEVAKIRVRVQAGYFDEAAILAHECKGCVDDPQLVRVVLTAFLKRGNPEDLHHAAMLAAKIPLDSDQTSALAVSALERVGRFDMAIATGERALDAGLDGGQLRSNLAHAYYVSNRSMAGREKAVEHFRKAQEFMPDNFRVTTFLADSLVRTGRTAEAIAPLKICLDRNPNLPHVRVLCARAMKHEGDFVGAADQFQRLMEQQPESSKWCRYAVASMIQAGRRDEANELFANYVAKRDEQLPASFDKGLEQLWDKVDTVKLPAERLDWAWSVRDSSRYKNRTEWERRAKWGYLADHYLLDWLECRSDFADEAMGRLSDLTRVDKFLCDLGVSKRSVILVSAHVGPMYAGPMTLRLLDIRASWLASTPSVARSGYADTLVSTSDQTETQVVRTCIHAIKDIVSLAMAVDGAINLAAATTEFLGQEVTYSSFCSRLAHKLNVPTVFCAPAWKDGRIDFVMKRLVTPRQAESVEDFVVRWRLDFLDTLAGYLRGAPENLRLSGGIWRNIVSVSPM
jgi:tetratricopeptide (TPR) repeat protein